MKVIRFAVEIDCHPDVKRVIEIPAESTFEDLHFAVLSAVDFDTSQLASFYLCDDEWDRKLEITLIDMESEDSDFTPVMRDTELEDYITEKGMKLIYEYDFALLWKFLIVTEDIYESEDNNPANFPILVTSEGDSPEQYGKVETFVEGISAEDDVIINHLEKKNHEFFTGDEVEIDDEFGDLYDEDDLDGFGEDFG
ncbi:MAG: hypothetical protein EOP53_14335, partial [Sphingobacteriales bacterium]